RSQAQGIRPGFSLASAQALAGNVTILPASDSHLTQVMHTLAEHALQFSDQVCHYAPQALVLECGSMLRLFGGLDSYWLQLGDYFRQLGYQIHLATGVTATQAYALALQHQGIATDTPDVLRAQIRRLHTEALPLPARVLENMLRTGLDNVDQLLTIPRREIARRFGPETLSWLERLAGDEPEPMMLFDPPARFDQHLDLLEDISHAEALLFPLRRLFSALESSLRLRNCQVNQICLTLTRRDAPPMIVTLGHPSGTASAQHWLSLCKLRFERLHLPHPVRLIRLQADHFQPCTAVSDDLFGETVSPLGHMQQLVAQLQARLGDGALKRVGGYADHRPERAGTLDSQLAHAPALSAARPVAFLEHPLPVNPSRLTRISGPERLIAGWWDHAPIQRDYYMARLDEERLCWVFRTPQGHWFIHGWFS
ncbi:MAG: DNA polymerase Y family protein, partial [Gammaproteobacteria bacterium]